MSMGSVAPSPEMTIADLMAVQIVGRCGRKRSGAEVARLLLFADSTAPAWPGWLLDDAHHLRVLRGAEFILAQLDETVSEVQGSDALEAVTALVRQARAALTAGTYTVEGLRHRGYTVHAPVEG